MTPGKFSEEYVKYLLGIQQKSSSDLNSLFRLYFLALITFAFAPSLSATTPEIVSRFNFYFIAAAVVGIFGTCLEFLFHFLAKLGAQKNVSNIFEKLQEMQSETELDYEKLLHPNNNYDIYCKYITWTRIGIAIIGAFCVGKPLLSWLLTAHLKTLGVKTSYSSFGQLLW